MGGGLFRRGKRGSKGMKKDWIGREELEKLLGVSRMTITNVLKRCGVEPHMEKVESGHLAQFFDPAMVKKIRKTVSWEHQKRQRKGRGGEG